LYELGIDPGPDYAGTALAESVSMAVHESQSRLWGNLVGRSAAFWRPRYGRLRELAGGALDAVGLEAFVAGVNKVEPSHIRVEADEVTYGLHVILRFELEGALISGDLAPRDLPGAWREKAAGLLGLVPPSDAAGCLQDVHWSAGLFGYFPSYLLGNLYAAQFWGAMRDERPGLDAELGRGEVGGVLAWLRERIHGPGAVFTPGELVERVTGAPLDAGKFVAYLGGKYGGIYGF
jgi:carboxypeptidase Taq